MPPPPATVTFVMCVTVNLLVSADVIVGSIDESLGTPVTVALMVACGATVSIAAPPDVVTDRFGASYF